MTEKRFYRNRGTIWENDKSLSLEEVEDKLNQQYEEIAKLKNENNMLKTTIGRNEAYINRLTHTSQWSNTAGG